ncbi:hypothetical protein PR048_009937 [Dryococelus australis]|uniref:Reverse transcriptase domain-containing protein n=1 Tax=Dryococelus australis TaxID=614101 RepID=A0ABQ9I1C1_9NEOP|nr:hypothetical protein PR048_009937 [Dryococelus australis]
MTLTSVVALQPLVLDFAAHRQRPAAASGAGVEEQLRILRRQVEVHQALPVCLRMAVLGSLGTFVSKDEPWEVYIERFKLFVNCNFIPEKRKLSTLLASVGTEKYNLLHNLCTPKKPAELSYAEVIKIVHGYVHSKPNYIAERFKFGERVQSPEESILAYVAASKELSKHCDFGTSLSEQLWDRLVGSVQSERVRQKLLMEEDLSYERAVKLATNIERAEREAATFTSQQLQLQPQHCNAPTSSSEEATVEVHQTAVSGKGKWKLTLLRYVTGSSDVTKSNSRYEGIKELWCFCCGRNNHTKLVCRYRNLKCRQCGRQGHLQVVCKDKHVNYCEHSSEVSNKLFKMRICKQELKDVYTCKLSVQGALLEMEIDTGSAISYDLYCQALYQIPLQTTSTVFLTYQGGVIKSKGVIDVTVRIKNVEHKLPLYVKEGGATALVGREWLRRLNIQIVMPVGSYWEQELTEGNIGKKLMADFPEVFEPGLGTYSKGKVSLHVKSDLPPQYFKPGRLPFTLRNKVENELERLVQEAILEPVESSELATSIVPIVKKDGTVRICGDYKITVNLILSIDRYPVPLIEDLLGSLCYCDKFSKIDLTQAYQQVLLVEDSKKYVTISTHRGLFRYNRIPYDIASGPGLFQRIMEQLLAGRNGVVVFLDDVLITVEDDVKHVETLREIYCRLKEAGLCVQHSKCQFLQESVEYCGYRVDKKGLHTTSSNVAAVWELTKESVQAIKRIKEVMVSASVLAHYEPGVPLKVACDASQYGLGAVLSHIYPDKAEIPITYASCMLSNAEYALSRVPLKITEPDLLYVQYVDGEATYLDYVQDGEIPITEKVVRRETKIDPVLSKVLGYVMHDCELEKPNPAKCELQNWPFPTGPWQRIHVDFLGPWQGKSYLIVMDACSEWLEVAEVPLTAAKHTIQVLQSLFARFSLCTHLASDNGPPFTAVEFQKCLAVNGYTSTSYEQRYVSGANIYQAITILLSDIQNSVHCTTGETPARLMFGRPLRTIYDLLWPNLSKRVEENQHKQMVHCKGQAVRDFQEGQEVVIRNYNNENKWVKGVVIEKLSNVVYLVETAMGRVLKRHIDQLLSSMSHVKLGMGIESGQIPDFTDVNEVGKVSKCDW